MQCAFCSATLPATTVGVLDYLSETCTSGCDGEGRFDVRCPACSRIVASYDLPLGYDARNLAELLGKPLYQAGISEEWPGTVDNPASSIGDMAICGRDLYGEAMIEAMAKADAVPFAEYDGSFAAEFVYEGDIPAALLTWA